MSEHTVTGNLALEHEPVASDQVASGAPTVGLHALGRFGDHDVGVWEMTPGAMTDTEKDEVFVVLSGAATIEFLDTDTWMLVGPGDVVRLEAGTRTAWTVTQTLRKVYFS
jgi:Predicted enzyme of the cupin superfamily